MLPPDRPNSRSTANSPQIFSYTDPTLCRPFPIKLPLDRIISVTFLSKNIWQALTIVSTELVFDSLTLKLSSLDHEEDVLGHRLCEQWRLCREITEGYSFPGRVETHSKQASYATHSSSLTRRFNNAGYDCSSLLHDPVLLTGHLVDLCVVLLYCQSNAHFYCSMLLPIFCSN